MNYHWNDRQIEVRGEWTGRWLYLVPTYALFVDGDRVDEAPAMWPWTNPLRPRLEASVESDGESKTLSVEILSVAGLNPRCDVAVNDEIVTTGRVEVSNPLDHILVVFIIVAICFMLYVGPRVLEQYLGVQ